MAVPRLPDFLLHAVRAPGTSADSPSPADPPDAAAAGDLLYELLGQRWPDPHDLDAGLVVHYLGEDARTTYFGHVDDDADRPT